MAYDQFAEAVHRLVMRLLPIQFSPNEIRLMNLISRQTNFIAFQRDIIEAYDPNDLPVEKRRELLVRLEAIKKENGIA